ncbi:MAG: hypothetical protein KatS3mg129_2950 [Leptospiraceae bacterium]|nr:MAG: hypothetical protein KatS3mg129_2950 [Leptospiraceae bacterium]
MYFKYSKFYFIIILLLLLYSSSIYTDAITLKNGNVILGNIVEENKDLIKIKVKSIDTNNQNEKILTIERKEIQIIEYGLTKKELEIEKELIQKQIDELKRRQQLLEEQEKKLNKENDKDSSSVLSKKNLSDNSLPYIQIQYQYGINNSSIPFSKIYRLYSSAFMFGNYIVSSSGNIAISQLSSERATNNSQNFSIILNNQNHHYKVEIKRSSLDNNFQNSFLITYGNQRSPYYSNFSNNAPLNISKNFQQLSEFTYSYDFYKIYSKTTNINYRIAFEVGLFQNHIFVHLNSYFYWTYIFNNYQNLSQPINSNLSLVFDLGKEPLVYLGLNFNTINNNKNSFSLKTIILGGNFKDRINIKENNFNNPLYFNSTSDLVGSIVGYKISLHWNNHIYNNFYFISSLEFLELKYQINSSKNSIYLLTNDNNSRFFAHNLEYSNKENIYYQSNLYILLGIMYQFDFRIFAK